MTGAGAGAPADGPVAVDVLAAVRQRRTDAVTAPQGNLALVNTQWITGDGSAQQPIWGVPGLWSPLPTGVSGLRLAATAADGVSVDGVLVDGEVVVTGMDSATPSRIRFSDTVTGSVIASEDGDYALRVWDVDSNGNREFGAIDSFPYDPAWVIEAHFTPRVGASAVSIAHIAEAGKVREKATPGEVRFNLAGTAHRLVAHEDGASVLVVFADATTGDTTYSVGRFLRVRPGATGICTLDFNRAYLPPCAFSYHFSCPIPPAQNRLAWAIEAGERSVLNRAGGALH